MTNTINGLLLTCISLILIVGVGCKPDKPQPVIRKRVAVPKFDKTSAYNFVQKQVDFGPRVMNSEGHENCKNWMVETLKGYGAEVIEQNFTAKLYTGVSAPGTNVIGQFNPDHPRRIVLAAHWDTRHIADKDPDPTKQNKPILGADDGGSGVGVLLEIARVISENPIDLGVDIVFFDAEDYGNDSSDGNHTLTWCLGSQHWSRNLHRKSYKPRFGILLDMVGCKDAKFRREGISMQFAPNITKKVWNFAKGMGYSQFFIDQTVPAIVDDHTFVNQIAKIKMIDIIYRHSQGFGKHWHTHGDDMSVIDKKTLNAVGQVVTAVIYNESGGMF